MNFSAAPDGEEKRVAQQSFMVAKVKPRFKGAKPRFYFKEWRKFRHLTQEEVAERIGTSTSTISQLETGKQGFTDTTLIALAEALNCGPGDLLMRNPLEDEAPWSIWNNIPQHNRPQAIEILRTFERKKSGTDG